MPSAIAGTLSPQGIMVPASALQQGNVTMATVAGMTTKENWHLAIYYGSFYSCYKKYTSISSRV